MWENRGSVPHYGVAVLYALFIFITIPYVRSLQRFVYDYYGKSAFGYLVLAGIVLCIAGGVWYLIKSTGRGVTVKNYVWLVGVGCLYIYLTLRLWRCPEEAIHFLEYGLLSFLFYRALCHHVRDVTIYWTVSFIVLFVGTVDEVIQWIVPSRVGSFRDIWINFLAGGLFQVGLWKGIRPEIISETIRPRSVKILSGVVAGCLVLLGVCASLTPPRVDWIAGRSPSLSYLRDKHHMISEYGYRHKDREAGIFYSRFTKKELLAIDHDKQQAYSRILDEHAGTPYNSFLKTYNPLTSPFLYEMRIHLFRRDQHTLRGNQAQGSKRAGHYTIAYRENLLLETYFGETLRRTVYRWPDSIKKQIKKLADINRLYESPVSSDLFTLFTERGLWTGIVLSVCVILGTNIYFSRFRKGEQ